MPPLPLSAGIAAPVLDLVRIFRGGRLIDLPMVGSDWPERVKAVRSGVWHAATAMMAPSGLALIAEGLIPDWRPALAALPVALVRSATLLFLTCSVTRLGSVWILPPRVSFPALPALGPDGLA